MARMASSAGRWSACDGPLAIVRSEQFIENSALLLHSNSEVLPVFSNAAAVTVIQSTSGYRQACSICQTPKFIAVLGFFWSCSNRCNTSHFKLPPIFLRCQTQVTTVFIINFCGTTINLTCGSATHSVSLCLRVRRPDTPPSFLRIKIRPALLLFPFTAFNIQGLGSAMGRRAPIALAAR
jgi:hypothetical protein